MYVYINTYKMFIFLISLRVNWRCDVSLPLNTSICISLKADILNMVKFCPNNILIALLYPSPHSDPIHILHVLIVVKFLQSPLIQSNSSALNFFSSTGQVLCWVALNLGWSYGSACLDSSYAFWAGIPLKWGYHISKHRLWDCPSAGDRSLHHLLKMMFTSISTVKLLFFPL